jgi:hypothetical protein
VSGLFDGNLKPSTYGREPAASAGVLTPPVVLALKLSSGVTTAVHTSSKQTS